MGIIKRGILGGFSGRIGNVIGSSWNGIQYIKAVSENVNDAKTEKQMSQRQKFALVGNFLRLITPLIKQGYGCLDVNKTPFNAAMSYHLKYCVEKVDGVWAIDYEKVKISRGPLGGVTITDAGFVKNPNDNYYFELQWEWDWDMDSRWYRGENDVRGDDQTLFMVHNVDRDISAYFFNFSEDEQIFNQRSYNIIKFSYPKSWENTRIEVYIGFRSRDGVLISDSQHVGRFVVPVENKNQYVKNSSL